MGINRIDQQTRPQVPEGDTFIPGLDLKWSALMLIVGESDQAGSGGAGHPPGNLVLPKPLLDMATIASELMLSRLELASQTSEGQEKTLELRREQQRESMNKAMQELRNQLENTLKAMEEQKKNAAVNWVKAVFGLIGAVVAAGCMTALSGGAAVAAGIGVVVSAVLALLDTANAAAQSAGATTTNAEGKTVALEISIAAAVRAGVENSPETKNLSPQEREDLIRERTLGVTIFLTLVVVAGGLACAEGLLVPAAQAAKACLKDGVKASTAWKEATDAMAKNAHDMSRIELMAEAANSIAGVGEMSAVIAGGILKIHTAEVQRDANDAKALAELFNSIVTYLSKFMTSDGEFLADSIKSMNDDLAKISDMVAGFNQSQESVAANFS